MCNVNNVVGNKRKNCTQVNFMAINFWPNLKFANVTLLLVKWTMYSVIFLLM